jgi:hypothetical protein
MPGDESLPPQAASKTSASATPAQRQGALKSRCLTVGDDAGVSGVACP